MRAFITCLATETNTFAPMPTAQAAFEENGIVRDASRHSNGPLTATIGALRRALEAQGVEVIESISAFAQPAGRTLRPVYEGLRDTILADLRAAQASSPVELVLPMLHGAMVAEGIDDCEGDILHHLRALAPSAVIGTVLDLHAHLSEAMVRHADWVITVKEYPHIDFAERVEELVALSLRMQRGEIAPVAALVDTRLVGIYPTFREPMKGIVGALRAAEQVPGVLSASIAHGFPWADVAERTTRVLVYTDGDAALAQTQASAIAERLYGARQALRPQLPGVADSLERAATLPGLTVLADFSDNPGGGGAGDSTFFLAEMLRRKERHAVFGCLWDPSAVRLAFDAGVGTTLKLRLGGRTSVLSGDPVDVEVTVRGAVRDHSEGMFGSRQALGDAVWLQHGGDDGLAIAVVSQRAQVYEGDAFTGLGITLADKRLVVLKSSSHYEAAFAPIAQQHWAVQTPGAMRLDFEAIPYTVAEAGPWFPKAADPWAAGGVPIAQVIRRVENAPSARFAQEPLPAYREYPKPEMIERAQHFHAELRRRRSVRDFESRAVPGDVIDACLLAAGTAPSGANQQPWFFSIVTDPARKRRIRLAAEEEERAFYAGKAPQEWLQALAPLGTDADKPFLEEAPVLIAIFAQKYGVRPDGEKFSHYYVPESVGIACGFLIAALHQAGLATLTHTPSPMGFLNEICGRPASEKPVILLVVGYPKPGCLVPVHGGIKKPLAKIAQWLDAG